MATYILNNDDRVTIARQPVTATVSGNLADERIELVGRADDGPVIGVRTPRPGLLVIPEVRYRTVLQVRPAGGPSTFPEGTVLDLAVRGDAAGAAGDTVIVQPVDVSGLSERDLVVLDVAGSRMVVAALGAVREPTLTELASAARAAARARLARDRTPRTADVVVAIDQSASMAIARDDGSLAAAVDVVLGLSHVIAWDAELSVRFVGDRVSTLPRAEPAELARAAVAELDRLGLGCGFRSAAPELAARQRTITYLLTDGVPADMAATRAAHRRDDVRHLVLLGADRADRPGSSPGGRVDDPPVTSLPAPPTDTAAGEYLLRHQDELADLVDSLLVGPDQAGLTERVAR